MLSPVEACGQAFTHTLREPQCDTRLIIRFTLRFTPQLKRAQRFIA